MDPATGLIDSRRDRDADRALAAAYNAADPFPHIVIDDFLPRPILEMCLAEFAPDGQGGAAASYDRPQERLKREYRPEAMSPGPRVLFHAFNSRPFLRFLEDLTGIGGLIPDPHFLGAGFHEILTGGHLSVHADFNHHKPMDLERRINVLVYLNEGWEEAHGGALELWDAGMTRCVRRIVPAMNRCVVFNTTSTSWHGNPQPVAHPAGTSRKSIALYYYTATWDGTRRDHTTQFRTRPGTADSADSRVLRQELISDLVPPILLRAARNLVRRGKAGRGSDKS